MYGYALQSPARYSDPTGEFAWPVVPIVRCALSRPCRRGARRLAEGACKALGACGGGEKPQPPRQDEECCLKPGSERGRFLDGTEGLTEGLPTVPAPRRSDGEGEWTAVCRARCRDDKPGNCPDPNGLTFAFGKGGGATMFEARAAAERNARSFLSCQIKHSSCKCRRKNGPVIDCSNRT